MRLSIGQYALRATCGLGLLLLPAIQQKLCTRPAPSKIRAQQAAEPGPTTTSDRQPKKTAKKPLKLAALVPDTLPPRRPNHAVLTAVQRVRPLPAATQLDGSADSQGKSSGSAGFGWALAARRARELAPQCPPVRADLGVVGSCGAVFRTSILRTGPPHA
jgi:hypothetical protein